MKTRDLDGLLVALRRISAHQIGTHRESDAVTRVFAGRYSGGPAHFGLPSTLVAVADMLLKRLPWEEARETVLSIPEAIGRSGRDLRDVIWLLLAGEAGALAATLQRFEGNVHILRVAGKVENGLLALADRRPWGVDMVDLIKKMPREVGPAPGSDRYKIADHHGYRAFGDFVEAALFADIGLAASVRRRRGGSGQPERIDFELRRAEEALGHAIEHALEQAVEAAAATAVGSDGESQTDAAQRVRLAGHRRQAASLLHVIRTGGR